MTAFSILGFQFYVSVFLLVPECDALCFFLFCDCKSFVCFLVQGSDGSSTSTDLLQRSPSKRRWIFDSLKTYALFYSGVSLYKMGNCDVHTFIRKILCCDNSGLYSSYVIVFLYGAYSTMSK